MMVEGQNDYPLAKALKDMGGYPHHVKDWEDTRTQLEEFSEFKLRGLYV